jgi:hypothetical protein
MIPKKSHLNQRHKRFSASNGGFAVASDVIFKKTCAAIRRRPLMVMAVVARYFLRQVQ